MTVSEDINVAARKKPRQSTGPGTFAHRLAQIAALVGNKSKLSRLSGVDRRAIGRYLDGENEPSADAVRKLAQAAKVNPLWLWTGEGPQEESATQPPTDFDLLQRVVTLAGHAAAESQRPVSPEQFGAAVRLVYEMAMRRHATPLSPQTLVDDIQRTIALAAGGDGEIK